MHTASYGIAAHFVWRISIFCGEPVPRTLEFLSVPEIAQKKNDLTLRTNFITAINPILLGLHKLLLVLQRKLLTVKTLCHDVDFKY